MTARVVDLLQLVNTWAQAQTFSGAVTCNGWLTSGVGTITRGGSYFQNAKTAGLHLQNNDATPLSRFMAQLSNNAAEDFYLSRYDNAGNYLSTPVIGYRASGVFDFQNGLRSLGQDVWRNGLLSLSLGAALGGVVFPNGLILNWGNASVSSGAPATVTLPFGYATAHVAAVANGPAISERFSAERLSLGQVKLYTSAGGTVNVAFVSVGY